MDHSAAIWGYTLGAVALVSLLSLVGAVVVYSSKLMQRALELLISFAAGALLGDAFLHIVPEIAESEAGFTIGASFSLLAGVVAFFILEKVLHWHHAHLPSEEVMHPVAVSNLIGDALHNLIDGVIIAGAFVVSTKVGIATAIAVALHEIPQELGDFAILIHAGLKPKRALLLNFMTALAAVAGAIITLLLAQGEMVERIFLPFTAGAFVYIAGTDLIPELHKEPEPRKSIIQAIALIVGIAVMASLLALE